jgi:hypothetical protein
MSEHESNVEALARGLIASDAARRVGWAKAFTAQHRVETLEDENAMLWAELEILRRAYSRLLGFTQTAITQRSPILDAELKAHFNAERTFRHDAARHEGERVGYAHLEAAKVVVNGEQRQQRHLARQRQADVKLRAQARELGHHAVVRAISQAESRCKCTCGQEFTGDQAAVFKWRNQHYGEVVHGVNPASVAARRQKKQANQVRQAKELLARLEGESSNGRTEDEAL